jgi:hypothetical protein
MSPATHYEPTPVLTAQRGGLAPTATSAKMSLYDLMGRFWQLDAERPFTPTETRLYFYWLNQFNAARWVASLPRRPLQVCADLGLTDKTLAVARIGLTSRGLMSYTEGHRRLSAVWALGSEAPEAPQESRNYSGLPSESAPKKAGIIPANNGGETGVSPQESRNNSGDIYKEEEKTLTTTRQDQDPAADAAGAGPEDVEDFVSAADCPADASHTEGGRPKPAGPRGWAYDPAALANNLRLPFASPAFRAAWVGYRTYREEQKFRRLTGGMMEQQQLDKLAGLAGSDEADALAIIAQTIAKGWQDFYPLDKPRPTTHASASATSKPGAARHHVPVVSSYGKL